MPDSFFYKKKAETICVEIIRWGIYFSLFVPLIVSGQFFFPFVAPKTTIFRIIVELIFLPYIFLAISNKKYRPRLNSLMIGVSVFLVVFAITSFTGVNFQRSFWSTYERMTGLWTMIHLFVFFLIITSVFKKLKDWERFLEVSIGVGILLSLYVLGGGGISTRGGGTIGNTSFMAAYLLFDIFFAMILVLAKRGWEQVFGGIGLMIMIPVLLTSTARGAIGAFLGGLFLIGLGYLFYSGKKNLRKIGWGIIGSLIVLTILVLIFQPLFVKKQIQKLLREMKPRFTVWEAAVKGWEEKPILGWGPENFNVVFNKYFNPCLFLSECGGEIWFDKAHNIILDTAVTMGSVGVLLYLFIFAIALFELLQILPKIAEKRHIFFPLIISVLLVIYFLQNLLVFDMINSYLMFFLTLGMVNFLIEKKREKPSQSFQYKGSVFHYILLVGVGGVLIFCLWWLNIQPLLAGHYLVKAIGATNVEDMMRYFQKSTNTLMFKYEAREHISQKLTRIVYQQKKLEGSKKDLQKAFELAVEEMEKSVKENPLDFRPALFLGRLYTAFYQFNGDRENLDKAEKILEKSITLSPRNQQGYWQLGEVKLAKKENEKAIKLFQKALALEPRYKKSYWFLAMAYKIKGDYKKAAEVLENSGFDWEKDLNSLKTLIEIYQNLKDDKKLISLYLKAISLDSKNPKFWAGLAASYANIGEIDKAKKAAKQLEKLDPSLKEKVEEFLNKISSL